MDFNIILIYVIFLCAMASVAFNVINQIRGIKFAYIIEMLIYALGFVVTVFCLRFLWGFWPPHLASYGPLWMYGLICLLAPVAYFMLKYKKAVTIKYRALYYASVITVLVSIVLHFFYFLHLFNDIMGAYIFDFNGVRMNGYTIGGYLLVFSINYFLMLSGLIFDLPRKKSKSNQTN